jgi:hypothetical protein
VSVFRETEDRDVKNPWLLSTCHVVGFLDDTIRLVFGCVKRVEKDPSKNLIPFVVLMTIGRDAISADPVPSRIPTIWPGFTIELKSTTVLGDCSVFISTTEVLAVTV